MTDEEMKQWIDNASYRQLLSKLRFTGSGDPFLEGEIGEYYKEVMGRKREEVGKGEHVRESNRNILLKEGN